jgi:hypothetical protein
MLDLLRDFIPFLNAYPTWIRALVAAWILLTALLLIAFLFLRNEGSAPKSTPEIPAAPAPPKPKADSETTPPTSLQGDAFTAQAYFGTLKKLAERFFQRDQFVAACQGRHVVWRGYVRNVRSGSEHILVAIVVELDSSKDTFYADCSKSIEAQLFSLRKGDHVEVTGTLNSIDMPSAPDIKSNSVHLVV